MRQNQIRRILQDNHGRRAARAGSLVNRDIESGDLIDFNGETFFAVACDFHAWDLLPIDIELFTDTGSLTHRYSHDELLAGHARFSETI